MTSNSVRSSTGLGKLLAISSLATAAGLFASIARGKITAVTIGLGGLGTTSEIQQTVAFVMVPLAVFSGPALTTALLTDRICALRALLSARAFTLVCGLILTPVAIGIGLLLFKGETRREALWLALSAVFALATALFAVEQASLLAFQKVKQAGLLSVLQAVTQTIGVAVGTTLGGIDGQFICLAIASLAVLPVALYVSSQHLPPELARASSVLTHPRDWDRSFLASAALLGLATAASGFAAQGMWSLFRFVVHNDEGAIGNGLLQAARTTAVAYFGLVLQGLSTVVFPLFAAAKTPVALDAVLRRAIRLILLFAPPVILAAMSVRRPILVLLFAPDFANASELAGLFMASDLSKAFVWALGGPLLYLGKARAFVLAEITSTGLLLLSSMCLYWWRGTAGIGAGHIIGYSLSIATNALFLRKTLGVGPTGREVLVCLLGTIALSSLSTLSLRYPGAVTEIAMLLFATAWLVVSIRIYRKQST